MSTTYTILKATDNGTYSTQAQSIAAFDGKTFVITNCYNPSYENSTYTGYWANNSGSVGYEISFAAPRGTTAQSTWTGAELYYNTTAATIKDAVRIPMTKTTLVTKAEPNTTNTTLKAGEWSVYTVKLTEEQIKAIDSSKLAGFVAEGREVRTGARKGKTILNSTTTNGKFTTGKTSIKEFVGKTFIITDAYDKSYERSTYTGYWSTKAGYTSTATATIRFAAPSSWKGVNLYYNNAPTITGAQTIAMKKTASTKAVEVTGLKTVTSGNWAVYEVTLTADQISAIDESIMVGFVNSANSNMRTNAGKLAYSAMKATTSGKYDQLSHSVVDYDGLTFVINGCSDAKFESKTYIGAWAA